MTIHTRENAYRGINAHLHSHLQANGGWPGFHSEHIVHLREAIEAALPADSGYFVLTEQSLQVAHYDFDEVDINAIVIVQGEQPVTRIELLSPANKPAGSHHAKYLVKREETLLSGVNLVELDYLHASGPLLPALPDYRAGAHDAYPYLILVSDAAARKTDSYGVSVDVPLPRIALPLLAPDQVALDFDAPYQRTYTANRYYAMQIVDYTQEPINMDAYSADDQACIRAVMVKAQSQE